MNPSPSKKVSRTQQIFKPFDMSEYSLYRIRIRIWLFSWIPFLSGAFWAKITTNSFPSIFSALSVNTSSTCTDVKIYEEIIACKQVIRKKSIRLRIRPNKNWRTHFDIHTPQLPTISLLISSFFISTQLPNHRCFVHCLTKVREAMNGIIIMSNSPLPPVKNWINFLHQYISEPVKMMRKYWIRRAHFCKKINSSSF